MQNLERAKPGRKAVSDKKEMVGVYLRSSEILKLGGKEETRNYILNLLKNQNEKSKS